MHDPKIDKIGEGRLVVKNIVHEAKARDCNSNYFPRAKRSLSTKPIPLSSPGDGDKGQMQWPNLL